jgi:hypothetical protein
MQCEDFVHTFERVRGNHVQGSANRGLFRGLENTTNSAKSPNFGISELECRTYENCCVHIVTAGMAHTRILRTVWNIFVVLNREGVQVCA